MVQIATIMIFIGGYYFRRYYHNDYSSLQNSPPGLIRFQKPFVSIKITLTTLSPSLAHWNAWSDVLLDD